MVVFVLNRFGKPLMPCKPAKARHLLKAGKAKVVKRTPFTIRLLFGCGRTTQEIVAGMDTGSKTIGCAAISNGKILYQSETILRRDIPLKMKRRSTFRKVRRSRKCRYRKPRWQNRSSWKRPGRLAPTIRSKLESHLRERDQVEEMLPISKWKVETAQFDISKISNPQIKKWEYAEGPQKDFYNVKTYILSRDK